MKEGERKKIGVVGAGGTGYSVAAELSLRGYSVALYDIFAEKSYTKTDVPVALTGSIAGQARIAMITSDPRAALSGAGRVICCTISNADEAVARAIAPCLSDDCAVLLSAGNLGSLIYRRVFAECGRDGVLVGETSGNLFSCRRTAEDSVFFGGAYDAKNAAAFPAARTAALIEAFRDVYELHPAGSILEAAFNGPNLLSHIALTIVNAGAIENCEGIYYSFRQAVSPCTITLVDELWKEKKAVMDALGLPCGPSPAGNFQKYRDPQLHAFDNFKALSGPNSLSERHITEDIPIIGCLFLSVAEAVGVQTPLYRALVTVASAFSKTDFYQAGRTLVNLGLGGLRRAQVAAYFQNAEI